MSEQLRDPREGPFYRGPEMNGLSADEAFDLAKQMRIAARVKRVAREYGASREAREKVSYCWMVALSIAAILAGLALVMHTVHLWV